MAKIENVYNANIHNVMLETLSGKHWITIITHSKDVPHKVIINMKGSPVYFSTRCLSATPWQRPN